jgi:glycosyltransferase involved in cell wall biosynthesis
MLSIVSTVYNKDPKSLDIFFQALDKQTSKDFEVILVDDCSDLDYQSIVSKYYDHFKLEYIRLGSNKGQCFGRNLGIRETTGNNIAIIDSDCICNSQFVEAHLNQIQDNDILIGAYNIESNGRDIWNLINDLTKNQIMLQREVSLQFPSIPNFFLNFITRNISFKRHVLSDRPMFDDSFGYTASNPDRGFGWEDIDTGYNLFRDGFKFGYTLKAFTVHLTHPSTTDPLLKPFRSMKNFNRLIMKNPQMIYTTALSWILETYDKIYSWIENTVPKQSFTDSIQKNITVELSEINKKLPFVIENLLINRQPHTEIILQAPIKGDFRAAEYYSRLHSYVKLMRVSKPTGMIKDDQIIDDLKHLSKPILGGFQSPTQFFTKDLAPKIHRISKTPRKNLKILTYRWHCGHQYELWKLPHTFFIAEDKTTMAWDYSSRPLPSNAHFIKMCNVNPNDYDLAILHFDENCFNPSISNGVLNSQWGAIFRRFLHEIKNIPRIGICHGTPPFHGMFNVNYNAPNLMQDWKEEIERIKTGVGNLPIICNSWHAWDQWKFPNSKVIWQGFNANEYPVGRRHKGFLYSANSIRHRPWYRGYFEYKYLNNLFPIDYLGRDDKCEFRSVSVSEPQGVRPNTNEYAIAKFNNYQNFIGDYSVFVNTTLKSPMPRTRTEAMLKGLCCVTFDYHDESMFINNGINGFVSKTKEEMADQLKWCQNNPDKVKEIGLRGRETAKRIFPHTRYLQEWQETIFDLVR